MSSSETVAKREAILIPVPKQWIAKDIPSFTTADQNARKLLSTDLVNTNEKCYSSWFLFAWDLAPEWEERSNKENKYRRAKRVERWIGEGERTVEPEDIHAFVDWSNVFMLTDSRCCWQYRALSVSRSYNSGKDFWKHGFRASNWQISLRLAGTVFENQRVWSPFTYGRKAKTDRYCLVWQIFVKITAIPRH